MADRRKLDDPLAAPLARALAAGLDRTGRECPDAETLALYFERGLEAGEAARWELHFAACAHCQEQLAAMARMETAAAPVAPEAARPSGVSWPWSWRWLAPAAAALGALAIWVVVSNIPTTTRPTESAIAQNMKAEPSSEAGGATSPQEPEGVEPAPKAGKTADLGSGPAFAPAIGRTASGQPSEAGAKQAAQPVLESKPSEGGKRAAATRLADRADTAASPKVPATGVGALQAAPGASADKVKKDEKDAFSEFAVRSEPQKAKEEAQLAREVRTAEVTAVPQQQTALNQQQGAVQAPSPAPARVNEQQAQAGRDAAQKTQVAPQAAQDELKKTDSRAPAPAVQTIVVMPSAVPALRQERERDSRRAANVVGAQVVWRLGPAGSIERSVDSGATWQRQASGVNADLLAGSAPSATVCWAVGRGGVVLRTTDGSTWSSLGSPTSQDLIAVLATDAERATVTTTDGKRYATADGGRTWRSL